MRRDARQGLERAQEMVAAERLQLTQHPHDSCRVSRRRRGCIPPRIARHPNDGTGQLQRDLLEQILSAHRHPGARRQRCERAQRWQAITIERGACGSRIVRETLEQLGVELKRKGTDHPRRGGASTRTCARRSPEPGRRTTSTTIRDHPGRRRFPRARARWPPTMPFLEGTILRPGRAHDVDDPPPLARGHGRPLGSTRCTRLSFVGERDRQRITVWMLAGRATFAKSPGKGDGYARPVRCCHRRIP
jgi:hypothetical protein